MSISLVFAQNANDIAYFLSIVDAVPTAVTLTHRLMFHEANSVYHAGHTELNVTLLPSRSHGEKVSPRVIIAFCAENETGTIPRFSHAVLAVENCLTCGRLNQVQNFDLNANALGPF